MIAPTRFLPLPKDHTLIVHNYRIPQFSWIDAFDKTISLIRHNNPGLIPPNLSYGEVIAFILPVFSMHDSRLKECVPNLSIDSYIDAAIALLDGDPLNFMTLLRYASKEQFDALETIPDFYCRLKKIPLENIEPYLNCIDIELKGWIGYSKAFSPIPLVKLIYSPHIDENTEKLIKEIPPVSFLLILVSPAKLALYMESDQLKAIAKHASCTHAREMVQALKSANSPLISFFIEALPFQEKFIHLRPRYSLEKACSELKDKLSEIVDRVEEIRQNRFKNALHHETLESAISLYDSIYYRTAVPLFQTRLIGEDLGIFDRFSILIKKIRPPRAHESPIISLLAPLLKNDPSWFIETFSEKPEFIETCKYLKDKEPFFAETLSRVCIELMEVKRALIAQIVDCCEPYERNLLFSNLVKTTSVKEKIKLCTILFHHIDRFIEIWAENKGPLSEGTLIDVLKSCYDNIGSEFAIGLKRIPAMRKAILNTLPTLNITLIMAFIDSVDEATQIKLINDCKSFYDKLPLIKKLSSERQKAFFKSLNCDEFKKFVVFLETNYTYDSSYFLFFLKNCTDEQFQGIENLPKNLSHCSFEEMLDFVDTLSEERKRQILEKKFKGMKAKDYVRSCPVHETSSIEPFLLLFTELDDDYFKGERVRFFLHDQIVLIARRGKKSYALALEEGLKRASVPVPESIFDIFYAGLAESCDEKEGLSLPDYARIFNQRLKVLIEKAHKAMKLYDAGDRSYDSVIKQLRRCIRTFESNAYRAALKRIKENAPEQYDENSANEFTALCHRIPHLLRE